jgi:hypothetical protein
LVKYSKKKKKKNFKKEKLEYIIMFKRKKEKKREKKFKMKTKYLKIIREQIFDYLNRIKKNLIRFK